MGNVIKKMNWFYLLKSEIQKWKKIKKLSAIHTIKNRCMKRNVM